MKINAYKLEINATGAGDLFAVRNGIEIYVDTLDIANRSATQVNELVKEALQKHDMEIVDVEETILEKEDLNDRKADLSLVRGSMRKILKNYGNKNVSLEEKKELLDVYETMCKASIVMTKACVVELAYDKFAKEIDE